MNSEPVTPKATTLQDIDRPGLVSSLIAHLDGSGELVLSGHDAGDVVVSDRGQKEHRFRLSVAADRIDGLAAALHRELHDGHDGSGEVLDLLQAAFNTGLFSSAYEFRTWLRRSSIESSFSTI